MNEQIYNNKLIEPIIIGKIGSVYGICGWLRLFSSTEQKESIFSYQPWFIKTKIGYWRILLDKWKRNNINFIIKLNSIDNREIAKQLVNKEIIIEISQLPNLVNNNEYYWKDIIGCQVINLNGNSLGKVINIIETSYNDVLVIKNNLRCSLNKRECLIPFINQQVIQHIDTTEHIIKVDWDPVF